MHYDIPVDTLQQILDDYTASGRECGVQLAIYQHGRLEANLCSGYTDNTRSCRITADHLFPIFSTGKGIMTIAFHMLKEEFGFSYTDKVSKYWHEFTGNGREDAQILHILSHRTGLHMLQGLPDLSEKMADWDFMSRKMTTDTPKWQPGTKCGYQSLTFAWLLGELAFRISGIPFKKYIQDKIITPLGLEKSFYFGIDDEADQRFVPIDISAMEGKFSWPHGFTGNPVFRRAFIPSANGIATAEAVARIYNAVYNPCGSTPALLKKETIEEATVLMRHPDDPIPQNEKIWTKFGLGFVLPVWETGRGDIFGHGGAAGAEGFYCKSRDLAVCFVKNRVLPAHPEHPVRDSISRALGLPTRYW